MNGKDLRLDCPKEKPLNLGYNGHYKRYSNKNILIISHQVPLVLLEAKARGFSNQKILNKYPEGKRIKTGELRELVFK